MTVARCSRPLLAAALAIASVVVPAPAAHAARPDLTLVSDARYDVQPTRQRVRITLDITATNHLRDTITRRYFFDRAYLAVQPDTRNFRITSSAGTPTVSVASRSRDRTLLLIVFGRRLAGGRSAAFQLQFDLPDPGGAPTRDVRVGSALVSFPVWAFASNETPGSRVTIAFPPGYTVRVEAGELSRPVVDTTGRTTLTAGPINAPLRFYAFVVADRPGAYTTTVRRVRVGDDTAELVIRSWPDDPAWSRRVGGLFARALPAIGTLTGLPWTSTQPLIVQEAVSRSAGGFVGRFDPSADTVEVAYYAPPQVVLHEAAHAWFNGDLLADRWANEGFASYYAIEAARRLDVEARASRLTPRLRRAAIPLNAWAVPDRGSTATDDYAYAASDALARLIAKRAGEKVLREVWAAAADRIAPYQPGPEAAPATEATSEATPERVQGAPDWRVLLDLLEDRTGKPFDDLWATWVVRPEEAALLDARRTAIDDYRATLAIAGDWAIPRAIRDALRAWQFDQARELTAGAREVLERNEELTRMARAAGLRLPGTVRELFEQGGDFAAALSEADAELRTIAAFTEAVRARPRTPDPFQQLGLFGVRPESSIAAASAAFEDGDLVGALRAASEAQVTWETAADVGQSRFLTLLAIVVIVLLAIAWIAARVRRLRRHRRNRRLRRAPMAHRL